MPVYRYQKSELICKFDQTYCFKRTHRPDILSGIGRFGGLFELPNGYGASPPHFMDRRHRNEIKINPLILTAMIPHNWY